MKSVILLLLAALSAHAQFTNARRLSGKPLCSASVTNNCVANTDGSGTLSPASSGSAAYVCSFTSVSSVTCNDNLGTLAKIVSCFTDATPAVMIPLLAASPPQITTTTTEVTFDGVQTGTCYIANASQMGPTGATGETGATGPAGADGANGTDGADGAISAIQEEGSDLPVQPKLNFIGDGVTCANNAGQSRTDCTISSAGVSAGTSMSVSGATVSYNPFDTSQVILFDEPFCTAGNTNGSAVTSVGREGWLMAVVNGGTQIAPSRSTNTDANHMCGVLVTAPASTSNGEAVFLAVNAGNGFPIKSALFTAAGFRPFEIQWQAKIGSTSNIRIYLQLFSSAGIPTTAGHGCGIRYDTTLGDTGWVGYCAGNTGSFGTATVAGTVDTSIHRFRMWQTAQGTVNFSVDGGATTSISSQITTSTTTNMTVSMMVVNDTTSTGSTLELFRAVGRVTGLVVQ